MRIYEVILLDFDAKNNNTKQMNIENKKMIGVGLTIKKLEGPPMIVITVKNELFNVVCGA